MDNIEKVSVWDKLKNTKKPIVLYGMGDGADKILNHCSSNGIQIYDIFASDEFVRGHLFRGYKVKKFAEVQAKVADFIILVAFATRDNSVIEKICELGKQYELYVPDIPVFGDIFFDYDYFMKNIDNFNKVYSLLADDKSKEVFIDAVNFKISGRYEYLINSATPKVEVFGLFRFDKYKCLCYIDLGAYDGDTILELAGYLKSIGKLEIIGKIIAFEPDKKNFAKMQKNLKETDSFADSDSIVSLYEKCELYNIGAFDKKASVHFNQKAGRNSYLPNINDKNNNITHKKFIEIDVDTVDNIVAASDIDLNCSGYSDYSNYNMFIKYDVEGTEYEAVKGSVNTIKKYNATLSMALYHRSEDLFKLPLLINELNPKYKLYLRKHEYIPFWDFNLYAIMPNTI